MARLLIERETIYTDEVNMVMEGKSVEEIIAYMDGKDDKNPLEKEMENVSDKSEQESDSQIETEDKKDE